MHCASVLGSGMLTAEVPGRVEDGLGDIFPVVWLCLC